VPANLLLLSTADTDLLAASQADSGWKVANPARVDLADLPGMLEGVEVVVIRLLGGRRAWEEGLDAVISANLPTVVLSGEAAPDAELPVAREHLIHVCRVEAAEAAIFNRLQQISQSSEHQAERQAIEDAVAGLRILKTDILGFPDWEQK